MLHNGLLNIFNNLETTIKHVSREAKKYETFHQPAVTTWLSDMNYNMYILQSR